MKNKTWEDKVRIYDSFIDTHPDIQRKGKTVPYTSSNGYMFTLVNKDGEIGIRLPKESAEKFKEKFNSTIFMSHGAVMKDYVLIPDALFNNLEVLTPYLAESLKFVNSLKAK